MQTKMWSDKPKKASFKPFWHDQKLKAKFSTKYEAKGGARGRGNPYGGSLRGRGRGRGKGRGAAMTGYSARLNTAVTEAPDNYNDEEALDARQQINKNKLPILSQAC